MTLHSVPCHSIPVHYSTVHTYIQHIYIHTHSGYEWDRFSPPKGLASFDTTFHQWSKTWFDSRGVVSTWHGSPLLRCTGRNHHWYDSLSIAAPEQLNGSCPLMMCFHGFSPFLGFCLWLCGFGHPLDSKVAILVDQKCLDSGYSILIFEISTPVFNAIFTAPVDLAGWMPLRRHLGSRAIRIPRTIVGGFKVEVHAEPCIKMNFRRFNWSNDIKCGMASFQICVFNPKARSRQIPVAPNWKRRLERKRGWKKDWLLDDDDDDLQYMKASRIP